ncbi:MAG: C10 family peptidase [Syntrophales bacterium]
MRPLDGFGMIKGWTKALCLFFLLFAAAPLQAASDQQTVASNFLKFLGSDKKISSEEIVERNLLDPKLAPVPVAHIFKLEGGGYILVSTERSISPVKAYSLAGEFAALPAPYRKALLDELELRVRVAALPVAGRTPQATATSETGARWDFLLNFDAAAVRQPLADYKAGTTLISSHWEQGYPYNKFLPLPATGGSKNVLAGCVNVAAGQIMRYYKHPASGKGMLSYTWNDLSTDPPTPTPLKTILYHSYNWDNMPDKLDAATPEYQTDEVALLMRDLGVANRTNFGLNDSSASFSPESLVENFGYSTALASMDNSIYEDFLAKIKEEIAAERPLLLGLPNHMVVADGYSADDSGRKIHVNMGWGGSVDDFYFLDPPPDGTIPNFGTSARDLTIHYNIKPCTPGSDCYVNREAGDIASGLKITGIFDGARDKDEYAFYLKGDTSFSATRGYGDYMAFFISFINEANGNVVFEQLESANADTVITVGNLADGKYLVRASLCTGDGLCYQPDPQDANFNQYTVTLASQALTAEEQALADQNLRKPPVINSVLPDMILDAGLSEAKKILIDARDENGDPVALSVDNSNPLAVRAVLNGNILELTPTGTPKIASRIVITASADGQSVKKSFLVMTDNGQTVFGKSFAVSGTFAGQSDVQIRKAILDGACEIQGYNGYTNQAFFSSVLDASGNVIIPADDATIQASFTRALYQLSASLEDKTGGIYYPYQEGVGDNYVLNVSCPAAEVTPITAAGLLGIDLAGAYWPIIKPGDLNGDEAVNLADAILALQLLSQMNTTGKTIYLQADVDQTATIGTADVIFILQKIAALR